MSLEDHGSELPQSCHCLEENVFMEAPLEVLILNAPKESHVVVEVVKEVARHLTSLLSLALVLVLVSVLGRFVDQGITTCYGIPQCSKSIGGLQTLLALH